MGGRERHTLHETDMERERERETETQNEGKRYKMRELQMEAEKRYRGAQRDKHRDTHLGTEAERDPPGRWEMEEQDARWGQWRETEIEERSKNRET